MLGSAFRFWCVLHESGRNTDSIRPPSQDLWERLKVSKQLAIWRRHLALLIAGALACAALSIPAKAAAAGPAPASSAFSLFDERVAATVFTDPADAPVVRIAALDFTRDVELVTGTRPAHIVTAAPKGKNVVVVGTLGKNRFADRLIAEGKIDATRLRGAWETFLIVSIEKPSPDVGHALLILGSDRRGTAFGAYELSAEIGVSPWVWWADVNPQRRDKLLIPAGTRKFGPPSVRYRGIFINDEDWALLPWAAQTFDPGTGNIGPKTYAEVFRLLLRLKANTLWPAMHKSSTPFNRNPANTRLADEFAIVMGSSHAEPMLRNNVGEWTEDAAAFNYSTNPTGVRAYWDERARANADFESMWTLGMRGIHDSGMVGPKTGPQKIVLLEKIMGDQRAILKAHVAADLTRVPQIFVPYKEVLPLYAAGLKVPDDVTLVWPDDNFGYIRRFTNTAERERSGGGGVYYHLSYLGAPLAYLWLSTTPPALVQQEMTRAYDLGARRLWIANVGDIKPAEIGTSFFLEMAWDVERWRNKSQRSYLADWSGRTFGNQAQDEMAMILEEYFRLNFERRPEHLQWWLPGEKPRLSAFSADEISERLRRFDVIVARCAALKNAVAPQQQDAFFELVEYPVRAAAAANRRYFGAERYAAEVDRHRDQAGAAAHEALEADAEIRELTEKFNRLIAGGKWRHIMAVEPADNQWAIFRSSPLALPVPGLATGVGAARHPVQPGLKTKIEAEDFAANTGWRLVEGLGRGVGTMFADKPGAAISYKIDIPQGVTALELGLLPLFPSGDEAGPRVEIQIDSEPARLVTTEHKVETAAWAQAVLDNEIRVPIKDSPSPGNTRITITARGSGVAIDRIIFRRSESGSRGNL